MRSKYRYQFLSQRVGSNLSLPVTKCNYKKYRPIGNHPNFPLPNPRFLCDVVFYAAPKQCSWWYSTGQNSLTNMFPTNHSTPGHNLKYSKEYDSPISKSNHFFIYIGAVDTKLAGFGRSAFTEFGSIPEWTSRHHLLLTRVTFPVNFLVRVNFTQDISHITAIHKVELDLSKINGLTTCPTSLGYIFRVLCFQYLVGLKLFHRLEEQSVSKFVIDKSWGKLETHTHYKNIKRHWVIQCASCEQIGPKRSKEMLVLLALFPNSTVDEVDYEIDNSPFAIQWNQEASIPPP